MARYYDLIYSFKDYEEETRQIKVLINDLHPEAKTILDAGCGTGSHAMYLSSDFAVDGIDITSEFVEIAREKNRSGRFEVADMRNFDLGKTYDVVQCLFSSIGHLLFGEEVIRALTSFKKHLNPNGVILIEPWITPENWRDNDRVFMTVGESDDVKIVRMNTSERLGRLTRLNMAYLVGENGKVSHVKEILELQLYTVEEMLGFFQKAGLKVEHDHKGIFGRGLYVARPT